MVAWLYAACTLAIGFLGLSSFFTQSAVKQVLKSYLGSSGISSSVRGRNVYPDDPDLDEYGDNVHPMNASRTTGIMTSVTHEQFSQTAQEALKDIEPLWRNVDTTCTLQVSRRGVPKTKSERRRRKIEKDKISKMAKRMDDFTFAFSELPADNADAKMRLCRVNGEGDPTKAAVLTLASDIEYLQTDRTAFPAFLNKMTYAQHSNTTLYLFLGSADEPVIKERPGLPWSSSCAAEEDNSNHFLKPIAFLSLLELSKPKYEWIFFMDADAWFNDGAFLRHSEEGMQIDSYFNLSTNAISLVGSQNRYTWYRGERRHTPIILNGGLLGLRNDEWSRQFSGLWWRSRCGPKDQLGLWSILLAYWSSEVERIRKRHAQQPTQVDEKMQNFQFEFDKSAFASYHSTHFVFQHLMHNVNKIRFATGIADANDNDGGHFYKKTGFVATDVPLELPRVMILPTSSVKSANDLPALFSQSDPEKFGPNDTFICHIKLYEWKKASLRTNHCHERKICSNRKCGEFFIR